MQRTLGLGCFRQTNPAARAPMCNMPHRLLIIQPSYYRTKADKTVFKVRRRQVVPLTLPYLAALTPAEWEVKLLDEQLEPIDFGYRADLVAISPVRILRAPMTTWCR